VKGRKVALNRQPHWGAEQVKRDRRERHARCPEESTATLIDGFEHALSNLK